VYLPEANRESRRANAGGKETPMHTVHQDERVREELLLRLDEITRPGSQKYPSAGGA
jgi:hypothetical protein